MYQQVLLDEIGVERVVVRTRTLVEGSPKAVRIGREHHAGDVLGGVARHLREVGARGGGEVGRLTVVLAVEAEDHRSPGRFAGEFHPRFHRLGAADAWSGTRDARRGDLDQAPRQRQRRLVHHVVGDLPCRSGPAPRRRRARRGCAPRVDPTTDVVGEGVAVPSSIGPVVLLRASTNGVDVLPQGRRAPRPRSREARGSVWARQCCGDVRRVKRRDRGDAGIHDGALQCKDGS
jgi:hypothetical protein